MIARRCETFKGPLVFARIGHSTKRGAAASHENNLSSPWWLSQGSMEYLWGCARSAGTPLSTLVRIRCCIPHYWDSSCDLLYEAELTDRIDAWVGPGTFFPTNPSTEPGASLWRDDDLVIYPAGEFPQIFIPGLNDDSVRRSAWRGATVVPTLALDGASTYLGAARQRLF